MKPRKGLKYENHWGTVLELLGHDRILYSRTHNETFIEVWQVKVLKSGEPRLTEGNVYMLTDDKLAEWGFKPLKKYGTKLWKVLND